MKKSKFLSIVSLLVLAHIGWATDFGVLETSKVSLNNTYETPDSPVPFDNTNNFKIWLDVTTSDASKIYLSGFYQLGFNNKAKQLVSNSYDLTDLYFKTSISDIAGDQSQLDLTIGRSLFYDFSGTVLAHKLDGVQASLKVDSAKVRIGVGTTALSFNKSNGIVLSSFDATNASDSTVVLAPARLVSQIDVGINDLLSKKTVKENLDLDLSVSALYQLDLRSDVYVVGDTVGTKKTVPVNSGYFGLGLQSKLTDGLFVKLHGYLEYGTTLKTVGTVYAADTILAGMGDLSLNYFIPSFLNSRIDLGFNLSSGDEDANEGISTEQNVSGNNTSFFGISKRGGGYIFAPQFGNSYVGKLSWIGKLVQAAQDGDPEVSLGIDYFLFGRPVNGPISQSGVLKAGTTKSILAQEIDTSLSFRLLSDLSVKLMGGFFLPDDTALSSTSLPGKWKTGLELNLSF